MRSTHTFASLQLSALRDEKKRLRAEIKKTNSEEAVEQLTMIDEQIEEELKLVITQVLHECEERVLSAGIQDLPFKTKIANQRDVLGYVYIQTGREEDRRRVLVTDFRPLLDKEKGKPWGYACFAQSLGSGKRVRMTLRSRQYNQKPIAEGDIIYVSKCTKNKSGYWYLDEYHITSA